MVATALAIVLGANALLHQTPFWYWLPWQHDEIQKLYALATDPKRYDVIIIGSSVSDRAFIPAVIEEELDRQLPRPKPWLVYNASINSATFPAFIGIARDILGVRQQPKVVVLMLFTFNFNSASETTKFVRLFSSEPRDLSDVILHAPTSEVRWAAMGSLLHGIDALLQTPLLYRYRSVTAKYQDRHGSAYQYPFTPEAMIRNKSGILNAHLPVGVARREQTETLRQCSFLVDFQIQELTRLWLEAFTAEMKRKNIPLILTMSPQSRWMAENGDFGQRRQATAYIRAFAARHDLTFCDLSQEPYNFKETEFIDYDHLGLYGAERLSRRIVGQLLAPALGKP
jgi:hypothetical protein